MTRLEVNFVWEGRTEKDFEIRISFSCPGWSTSKTLGMLSSESIQSDVTKKCLKPHLFYFFSVKRIFFSKNSSQSETSKSFRRKRRWSSVCRSRAPPPRRRCPHHSYGAPWDASSQACEVGCGDGCWGDFTPVKMCEVSAVRGGFTGVKYTRKMGGKNGCEKFLCYTKSWGFFFLETDPENFWAGIDLIFLLISAVKAFEPISLPSLKAALSRTDLVTPRCISRVHISKSHICHCVTMSPDLLYQSFCILLHVSHLGDSDCWRFKSV